MGENSGRIFEWRPRIHLRSQHGIRIQYDGEQCIVRMNDDVVTRVARKRVLGWVDPSVVALTRLDDNPQGRRPLFQCYTPLYFSGSQTLVLAARTFFSQRAYAVNSIRLEEVVDFFGRLAASWQDS